jgi:hypothetical protein
MQKDKRLKAATKYAHTRLREAGLFVFGLAKGTEFERALMSHNVHKLQQYVALEPFGAACDKGRRDELPPSTVLTQMLFNAATIGKDTQAAGAMLEIAVDLLDKGEKLPDPLRIYVVIALRSYALMLSKKRGRKKETNFGRDFFIARAISELQQFKYKPTRNREEKQRESCCSIVVKVLADGGLNLSETAVEKIWERFSIYQPQELVRN